MRSEFEPQDIQSIAEKVAELLKPLLLHKKDEQEDIIFDVPGLCKYLHATPKWVHERTHLKEIPYYKLSNKKLAFRKRDIDKWLESMKIPVLNDFRGKINLVQSA